MSSKFLLSLTVPFALLAQTSAHADDLKFARAVTIYVSTPSQIAFDSSCFPADKPDLSCLVERYVNKKESIKRCEKLFPDFLEESICKTSELKRYWKIAANNDLYPEYLRQQLAATRTQLEEVVSELREQKLTDGSAGPDIDIKAEECKACMTAAPTVPAARQCFSSFLESI